MDATVLGGSALAVAAATGGLAWAVRGRSASVFGRTVYRGDPSKPRLALTFDDGPCRSTPAVLQVLAEYDVRATFFMCGRNVRRYPKIARAVHTLGHEIGNHTETHPYLHLRTRKFIHREVAQCQQTIQDVVGVTPRWFRAPYGVRWFGLGGVQEELGLTGATWTVIGRDWKWPAARSARLILKHASNGGIICLHDGRTTESSPDIRSTIQTLELILPRLRERGFEFGALSDVC